MIRKQLIKALEIDQKGDWDTAHKIVQQFYNPEACWIHAYLHRKEGDLNNADYWYARASKKRPSISLEDECKQISDHIKSMT